MAAILKWQLLHWWSKYFVLSFHILHIKFKIVCSGILSQLQCIYLPSPFNEIQNGRHSKMADQKAILQIPSLYCRKQWQKCQNITHWCDIMFQTRTDMDPFDMKSKWRLFQNGVCRATISRSATEYCVKWMKFGT